MPGTPGSAAPFRASGPRRLLGQWPGAGSIRMCADARALPWCRRRLWRSICACMRGFALTTGQNVRPAAIDSRKMRGCALASRAAPRISSSIDSRAHARRTPTPTRSMTETGKSIRARMRVEPSRAASCPEGSNNRFARACASNRDPSPPSSTFDSRACGDAPHHPDLHRVAAVIDSRGHAGTRFAPSIRCQTTPLSTRAGMRGRASRRPSVAIPRRYRLARACGDAHPHRVHHPRRLRLSTRARMRGCAGGAKIRPLLDKNGSTREWMRGGQAIRRGRGVDRSMRKRMRGLAGGRPKHDKDRFALERIRRIGPCTVHAPLVHPRGNGWAVVDFRNVRSPTVGGAGSGCALRGATLFAIRGANHMYGCRAHGAWARPGRASPAGRARNRPGDSERTWPWRGPPIVLTGNHDRRKWRRCVFPDSN